MKLRHILVGLLLAGASPFVPLAFSAEPVNLSYQVTIHGVPLQIIEEQGWWQRMDLEPGNLTSFIGGAQQIAAVASETWDIGLLGGAPAALGASRFKLQSTLILIDDSPSLALVVQPSLAEAVAKDPVAALKGKSYLAPVNTQGDYTARMCFAKLGLGSRDVRAVNIAADSIVDAFKGGSAAAAGIWAPHWLRMQKEAGAKVICKASDTDQAVYANMVVRPQYLDERMDVVARFTAMYLRALHVMKTDRAGTLAAMKRFYQANGVVMSAEEMEAEYDLRGYFDFDEQMALFDRSHGPSKVDESFIALGNFLAEGGTFREAPDVKNYINPKVLEYIDQHPDLKAFARGE